MASSTRVCGTPSRGNSETPMAMNSNGTGGAVTLGQRRTAAAEDRGIGYKLRILLRTGRRKPVGAVAAIVIAFLVIVAIIGPWISPYDPKVGAKALVLTGPSWTHPMGADQSGRDILSRIIWGARVSLEVSLGAVLVGS